MSPKMLVEALQKLEAKNWPLEHFKDFDCTYAYKLMSPDNPDMWHSIGFWDDGLCEWFDLAVLDGWLTACLEARGYKREIYQHFSFGVLQLAAIKPLEDRYEKHLSGWCKTELEALVQVCLAVADTGVLEQGG